MHSIRLNLKKKLVNWSIDLERLGTGEKEVVQIGEEGRERQESQVSLGECSRIEKSWESSSSGGHN